MSPAEFEDSMKKVGHIIPREVVARFWGLSSCRLFKEGGGMKVVPAHI